MVLYVINKRIGLEELEEPIRKTVEKNNLINYLKYDDRKGTYVLEPSDIPQNKKVKYVTKKVREKGNQIAFSGLTRQIKGRWYPTYNWKLEKKRSTVSSSLTRGRKIHDEIYQYLNDVGLKMKSLDKYTQALIAYFGKRNEIPQISELPCVSKHKIYATQADIIVKGVMKEKDEMKDCLILYELKTGHLTDDAQGRLKKPLSKVNSTTKNHAYLQLFYTKSAIEHSTCIKIDKCYVLNVYEDTKKQKVMVKKLANPKWFRYLLKNKSDQKAIINALIK